MQIQLLIPFALNKRANQPIHRTIVFLGGSRGNGIPFLAENRKLAFCKIEQLALKHNIVHIFLLKYISYTNILAAHCIPYTKSTILKTFYSIYELLTDIVKALLHCL